MGFTINQLFIGGRWVDPEGGRTMPVLNPSTEEIIGTAPVASVKDTARAIAAARTAFDEGPWGRMTPAERGKYIRRLGAAIERRRRELADVMVAEAGILERYADGMNVQLSIDMCFDMADRLLPAFSFREAVNPHFGYSMMVMPQITQGVILREPVGVASLITPFNGPLVLSMMKMVTALAAGCTVALKPSPYTPLEVLALGDLVMECDFPPGVVNVIAGDDMEAAVEMTTNPGVDIVSFTGSDTVGRKIMAQAAQDLKRVVLELGGKNAAIVFADADLDRVAAEITANVVFNSGQGCALLTRTLVERSVHDELVSKVIANLQNIVIGDPRDPNVMLGPVIRDWERTRIEGLIETGRSEGAELVFGGGRPEGLDKGFFLNPALFTGVENRMSIAQREIFGPVGAVLAFTDEEEAIRIANGTDYGLNAAVFTDDVHRAFRVGQRLRTGVVNINTTVGMNPDAPYGGYKHSGLGREGGPYGMEEFLEKKFLSWPAGRT